MDTYTGYLGDKKLRNIDAAQMSATTPRVARLVFWLFGRQINRVASRILSRAYERGVINSRQMHYLCTQFDPTQDGVVGRLRRGVDRANKLA